MSSQARKSTDFMVTLPNGDPYTIYTPTPKQLLFHQDSTPNLIAIGSRGSGKSLALRMDAHMRALACPGQNLILVRKTYKDLLKSHLLFVPHEMDLLGGTYHNTNYIATYPNGSRLFFSYVGSESDALNLLSAEFLAAYFDELSVIPWDFFTKLCLSVRVPSNSGLTSVVRAATNPLGPSAYDIRRYFVDKSVDPEDDADYNPADWGSVQINMQDNPHLDIPQYRKRFAGMPDHIKKAWLEGDFADENALFDFKPHLNGKPYHVINELDPKILKEATIYRAFDMGWFPDPAVCLWIAHLGNRYIVFHEQIWFKTVASDIAKDMKEYAEKMDIKRIGATYCDPSIDVHTGADVRTTYDVFSDSGIPMEPSINNRELYSSMIHKALHEQAAENVPRLQIYHKDRHNGCPYLVRTLPMMQFDPKHPEKLADHKDDHATVCLAYFLISTASSDRAEATLLTPLRPWQKMKSGMIKVLGSDQVKDRD